MARSRYIYLASNHVDEPLGAWTVRHELVTYIKSQQTKNRDYRVEKVLRFRDGRGVEDRLTPQWEYRCDDITEEILDDAGL